MLRDVFYYGAKPNVHPRERFAESLEDARQQCTTHSFWIINEFCDYRGFDWDFDFEFLPDEDVWAEDHNNVWPSRHQKDSGTWLCPKEYSDVIIYRGDVEPILRKNLKSDNWVELDLIDKFDFSWHPDPTDPPYIYKWGCKYFPAQFKHVLEYRVPGATQVKYMNSVVELLPQWDNWTIPDDIDRERFDFAWRPSPLEPELIYEFGTQWQKNGGPIYTVPGAKDKKYLKDQTAKKLPTNENWTIPENIDPSGFDFSWHPDATNPPYIYVFSTQWAFSGGPVYTVPGATEIKYVEDQVAIAKVDKTNWIYNDQEIDADSFDFSWHPYVEDQPYIYQFGTQWQKTGGPRYVTPGAAADAPVKYIDTRILKAKRLPNKNSGYWDPLYDIQDFDYSWHPDSTEDPYVYMFGNQWYPAEVMPTVEYALPGAKEVKYVHDVVATLSADMTNWVVPDNIDVTSFDFSWRPEPESPKFIYEFCTQWQKTGGPRYVMPGATEVKYIDSQKAKVLPDTEHWTIPKNIDVSTFDFSWHPDATNPPYVYVFPTPWAFSGGPVYIVPGAIETKYIEDQSAKSLPDKTNWKYDPTLIDETSFDFSWHPYLEDQPYIYQFGTQWQKTGGPIYYSPGSTGDSSVKYVDTRIIKATRLSNKNDPCWNIIREVVDFDWSWHPDELDEPYIYVFGNQRYSAEKDPTVEYVVPGATKRKYISDIVAKVAPDLTNWTIPDNVDTSKFDFSWYPDPGSPPYIYQFATLLDDIWIDDGPRYVTPDNDGFVVRLENSVLYTGEIVYPKYVIETTLEDLVKKHPTELFWALNKNINYAEFDFTWKPTKDDLFNVTVFGSPESETTHTYFVDANYYLEGHTDFNYIQPDVVLDDKYLSKIFTKPDMFFVDRSNPESATRFETLKAKYGSRIQKTRYLNTWVDTINRCTNRATTEMIWVLNSELDYSDFDFEYYPNPWQMNMVHVFGTQWSHWGTTFLVNCETFAQDTKYIKIIEHLSNLNFVKTIRAKATACVHDIVMIDHGNAELLKISVQVEQKAERKLLATIPYDESYLNTLKNFIKKLPERKEHYLWICSSVCNYSQFDFTYVCDPFSKDNLHVFPSGTQKFGDTFFIDVNKTKEIIDDMEKLEEYHKVNFNNAVKTSRLPEPLIVSRDDMHVSALDKITGFPYATIVADDNVFMETPPDEPMNLWSPETKNIIITSTGATRIIVPSEAKDIVTNELYEYPYIKRMPKLTKSAPLDIVFVSNGETVADQNYEHLVKFTNGLPNKLHRVDGINGRTEALHAAADSSETPWFFCIPAKLFINKKFDWNYQADRMQMPKHYIFNALNPVNDLFYGHQSMVLYNKNLVLGNEGVGLDFTLDSPHMSVELNSGTVLGDTDKYSTWRTAFREAVKLKRYADAGDEVAATRLGVWTSVGKGNYGEWSIKGAEDGIEFYKEVNGDLARLRQSYYWDWLEIRFENKY